VGDLIDEAKSAETDRVLARRDHQLAEVRRERDSARQALKNAEAEHDAMAARLALVEQIADLDPRPPKWLTPRKTKTTAHHAIVTTILSDSHFDEVVNPDEVGGVNAYDREIATKRLRRYYDLVCSMPRDYMAGVTIDGCVAMLGRRPRVGRHPRRARPIQRGHPAGHDPLLDRDARRRRRAVGRRVRGRPCAVVVGNHGRRTRKPRAKGRARDNYDWLIGQLVAREFRDDDRVTFTIPDAAHIHFDVMGTTYRLEHGDSAKGGGGWIGATGPVMRRHQKVSAAAAAMDSPFDHLVVGHWHTLVWGAGFTINGSSKGYDEYASQGGFGYEEPQQALWLTTPERGITMHAPLFVADRKAEKW
jgi:hypothetical protein